LGVQLTGELAVGATLAQVSGQARTGKVQGVHDQQGAGAGQAARRHVRGEEPPEVRLHSNGIGTSALRSTYEHWVLQRFRLQLQAKVMALDAM
jgi:hypothetical protein